MLGSQVPCPKRDGVSQKQFLRVPASQLLVFPALEKSCSLASEQVGAARKKSEVSSQVANINRCGNKVCCAGGLGKLGGASVPCCDFEHLPCRAGEGTWCAAVWGSKLLQSQRWGICVRELLRTRSRKTHQEINKQAWKTTFNL